MRDPLDLGRAGTPQHHPSRIRNIVYRKRAASEPSESLQKTKLLCLETGTEIGSGFLFYKRFSGSEQIGVGAVIRHGRQISGIDFFYQMITMEETGRKGPENGKGLGHRGLGRAIYSIGNPPTRRSATSLSSTYPAAAIPARIISCLLSMRRLAENA